MEYFTKTIERISQFVDSKGISMNKLSTEIGVSNSYFSKMVRNNASVGSDIIEKILRIYPDLNATWLMTGNGSMINKNIIENKVAEDKPRYKLACQMCIEKDRTIDAMKTAKSALQLTINTLMDKINNQEEKSQQKMA
jgi:transcriptional regulator with XRE-family HTH domain